ncbi:MAG: GxxExxY protein [Bacteroidia bacterium]|nr:GxxExxY protein [Bacteroidia bacterium]
MDENELSNVVIGAAIKIHKELGPGLLESVYQACLAHELKKMGHQIEIEKPLPVFYDGVKLDAGYRIDILVDNKLLIELKSVDEIKGIHGAQVLTYLKLGGYKLGLLINFNTLLLKNGIKRITH